MRSVILTVDAGAPGRALEIVSLLAARHAARVVIAQVEETEPTAPRAGVEELAAGLRARGIPVDVEAHTAAPGRVAGLVADLARCGDGLLVVAIPASGRSAEAPAHVGLAGRLAAAACPVIAVPAAAA